MTSNIEKKGVHYIDCKLCQSSFHLFDMKRNADVTDMQEYWDQDYLTGGRWMHSVHLAALVNLLCHHYHNESFFVWPMILSLDGESNSASQQQIAGDSHIKSLKANFVLPDGMDLAAVCFKELHYITFTLGKASPRLKKNCDKDWLLCIYDSLVSKEVNYLKDFEPVFRSVSVDPSSVEIVLEDVARQRDGATCGFHAYYNLFNILCNNQEDRLEAKRRMNSGKGNIDTFVRQFTVEQYRNLVKTHEGELIWFGNKIAIRDLLKEYGSIVGYDAGGKEVRYENRKCDEIWILPKSVEETFKQTGKNVTSVLEDSEPEAIVNLYSGLETIHIVDSEVEPVHQLEKERNVPTPVMTKDNQMIEHSAVDCDSLANSSQYGLGVKCESNVVDYPLSMIIDVVEGNNRGLDLSKLKSLASKRTDFNHELFQHNYRFNIKVFKDLSTVLSGDEVYYYDLSMELIKNTSEVEDREKLVKMLAVIPKLKNTFLMVSLYGEFAGSKKKRKQRHLCVGTVIFVLNSIGSYISNIAVTNQSFSRSSFGQNADGEPFTCRGIAGILVGVGQCYSRLFNNGVVTLYTWSYNKDVTRKSGCCWKSMGFIEADTKDKSQWPSVLTDMVEKKTFHVEENFEKFVTLKPMIIQSTVKFEIYPTPTSPYYIPYKLAVPPFIVWPAISSNRNDFTDHDHAISCLQQKLSRHEVVVKHGKLTAILFDVLKRSMENTILQQAPGLEGEEEMQGITKQDHAIPPEALDYFGFTIMVQFQHVYFISQIIMKTWYDLSYHKACNKVRVQDNTEGLYTEFDLIEHEANNRDVSFFFPLWTAGDSYDSMGHYIQVYRKWLGVDVHFMIADSGLESASDFVPAYSRDITAYDYVVQLFMNTPLWPLGKKAYWNIAPTVQQAETECGARTVLHSYMLFKSVTPHKCLLLLNNIGKNNNLSYLSRCWLSQILLRKKFYVPQWLDKLMEKDKRTRCSYTEDWKNKNLLLMTIDEERYMTWTKDVKEKRKAAEMERMSVRTKATDFKTVEEVYDIETAKANEAKALADAKSGTVDPEITQPAEVTSMAIEALEQPTTALCPTFGRDGTEENQETMVIRGDGKENYRKPSNNSPIDAEHSPALYEVPKASGEKPSIDENISPNTASLCAAYSAILDQSITRYYEVNIPKTDDGFMIDIRENVVGYEGYHSYFHGYLRDENGVVLLSEKEQVMKNVGDIVVGVNGYDMLGQCYGNVLDFIHQAETESTSIKLHMLDKGYDKIVADFDNVGIALHRSFYLCTKCGGKMSNNDYLCTGCKSPIHWFCSLGDHDANHLKGPGAHYWCVTCWARKMCNEDSLQARREYIHTEDKSKASPDQITTAKPSATALPIMASSSRDKQASVEFGDSSEDNSKPSSDQNMTTNTSATALPIMASSGHDNPASVDLGDSSDDQPKPSPELNMNTSGDHLPSVDFGDSSEDISKPSPDQNTTTNTSTIALPIMASSGHDNLASVDFGDSSDDNHKPSLDLNMNTSGDHLASVDFGDSSEDNNQNMTVVGQHGKSIGKTLFMTDLSPTTQEDSIDSSTTISGIRPAPWAVETTNKVGEDVIENEQEWVDTDNEEEGQIQNFLLSFKDGSTAVVEEKENDRISKSRGTPRRLTKRTEQRKSKKTTQVVYTPTDPLPCTNCTFGIANEESCSKCSRPLHKACGFRELENEVILFLCKLCAAGKKRYRQTFLTDANISNNWWSRKQYKKKVRGISDLTEDEQQEIERKEQEKLAKVATFFNAWLATVDEMQCKLINGNFCYYARNSKKKSKYDEHPLIDEFVTETLFQFFPNELKELQKQATLVKEKKGKGKLWYTLPADLLEFVQSHGRCYSNEEVFDEYHKCELSEWVYIKYNCNVAGAKHIVDQQLHYDKDTCAYFSFTNDRQEGPQVKFVPLYYLRVWTLNCNYGLANGQENEVTNIVEQAKAFRNQWVEIPQGAFKRKHVDMDKTNGNEPKNYRVQPFGERSCVFNSLLNALHYINDYQGRDLLLDHLPTSLNYQKMKVVSHGRPAFAAKIINNHVTGYKIKYFDEIDILKNRSMWPTLCVLKSSDNSASHAVTVVENYIFDSNLSHALELNKKNLDWCCSDYNCEETFQGVHSAYRFEKIKPRSEYVLRHHNKRLFAINSIIRAMINLPEGLKDNIALEELEKMRATMEPNQCIISTVREKLKAKPLGYRPVSLKCLNDVLLNAASPWPTMFLIHATGTFNYSVVSTVGNFLFDGTRGPSMEVTMDNIFNAVNPEHSYTGDKSSVNIIMGYRFVKDKAKEKKKRKLEDRDGKI